MTNSEPKDAPLLSLCIPTWNRAGRLKHLLKNIEQEIAGLETDVEVVIADNASTDDTAALVRACSFPVRYGRQQKTVGITYNILYASCELAGGKFVWVVGDDDLILPDGLRRIIDSLKKAPNLDYHYVNFSSIDADYRDKVIQCMNGIPPAAATRFCQCDDRDWKILERGEYLALLPGYNPASLFTSLFCYVANRNFYIHSRTQLNPSNSLDGSSDLLDDMYPQALITIPNIIGRPVAYIGQPCILQGANNWEWHQHLSRISILGLHRLLNWMESINFDRQALARMRTSQARTIATKLPPMLFDPTGHIGLNTEMREVIAEYTKMSDFWPIFTQRVKTRIEVDATIRRIAETLEINLDGEKIAIIGDRMFRNKLLQLAPGIHPRLSWVGFNDGSYTGQVIQQGALSPTHYHPLHEQNVTTVILAMHQDEASLLLNNLSRYLQPATRIISTCAPSIINSALSP